MNENFHNFAGLVRNWADERNITKGSSPKDQFVKLTSEVGELHAAMLDPSEHGYFMFKDAIGDIAVMLIIINHQLSTRTSIAHDLDQPHVAGALSVAGSRINVPLGSSASFIFMAAFGNLADAIAKNQPTGMHVMHCLDALSYLAGTQSLSVSECLAAAYNEIKDRKGVMFNGTFVKSTDPNYENVVQQLRDLAAVPVAGNA